MNIEQLIAAGGKLWESGDRRRAYFNDLAALIGFEVHRYGTGNISSAYLDGEHVSNTRATSLETSLRFAKLWFDLASGEWGWKIDDSRLLSGSEIAQRAIAALKTRLEQP